MLLDFAYGMLVDGAEPEEKEKIDSQLAALDEPDESTLVKKTTSDGKVIYISEARLAQIRDNAAVMADFMKRS